MHTRSTIFARHARHALSALALGLGLGLGAAAVHAASSSPVTEADIESRYRLDVERCNTGQTNQDKATCMREAGAARDEARRNRLTNANESYRQNETARCQALPIGERDECMLQMSGQNTTTRGSVGGGGVLRETTIEVPGTPTPAPPQRPDGEPRLRVRISARQQTFWKLTDDTSKHSGMPHGQSRSCPATSC